MKSLASIILSLWTLLAFAQLPVIPSPNTPSGAAITCANAFATYNAYTNLEAAYFSCNATNSLSDVNLLFWADQTANHHHLSKTNSINGSGNTAGTPIFRTSVTAPNGDPTIDFFIAGASRVALATTNSMIAQSNTVYVVTKDTFGVNGWAGNAYTFFDSLAGGRTLFQARGTSGGALSTWYCNGSILSPPDYNTTTYTVWAFIHNGASSVIYTNGVQFFAGNPGTGGLGTVWVIGTDLTGASSGPSHVTCILVYSEADSSAVVADKTTKLRSQYGF